MTEPFDVRAYNRRGEWQVVLTENLPIPRECLGEVAGRDVLCHGGVVLAGLNKPAFYIFDNDAAERGELVVRFPLPYSDLEHLTAAERQKRLGKGWPLEWSHTLPKQPAPHSPPSQKSLTLCLQSQSYYDTWWLRSGASR